MKPGQLITDGLAALSLRHSEKQADAFLAYLNELKKWSRAYNLTALKTDRDIVIKHFLNSLLYLEGLPRGAVSLIDVGSGAGFPGIAIWPAACWRRTPAEVLKTTLPTSGWLKILTSKIGSTSLPRNE